MEKEEGVSQDNKKEEKTLKLGIANIFTIEGHQNAILRMLSTGFIILLVLIFFIALTDKGKGIGRMLLGVSPSSTAAYMGPMQQSIIFNKTFIFWVPKYKNQNGKNLHEVKSYDTLHAWLITRCGGYTKWAVEGGKHFNGGGVMKESGFYYMSSVTSDKKDITKDDLYSKIAEIFSRQSLYIIEIKHQN